MKQKNLLTILCALWIMLAGCEVFPYVMETEVQPPPSSTTPSSQPDQTQVTMTSTPEVPPTATLDLLPDSTFTATATTIVPTATLTMVTETAPPILPPTFRPQAGNPIYLTNFAHPESECHWLGIAGQVFDAQGFEVPDLTIEVGDIHIGDEQQWSTQTGSAQSYGPGGYEIQISEIPQESKERFWVQVLDQNGNQLSDRIFFDTFNDCNQNLVLMNFIFIDSNPEKTMPTPTLAAYP
ncbi:MAG: hypothetical protein U9R53_09200 [Chloroflexota bacterium]|nr:hypothetical protein [Chloroflexota bacterium]